MTFAESTERKPANQATKKAQGRKPNHRPPGFHASCATSNCAHLTCVRLSALLGTSCPRHRVVHPTPEPDGAPLCPVAYPFRVSFLVTATTEGGASPSVEGKCMAPEDPCQGPVRFSFRQ